MPNDQLNQKNNKPIKQKLIFHKFQFFENDLSK